MAENLEQRIIDIVQNTLREQSGEADITLVRNDSMESVSQWDSLNFMSVFSAINEAFGLDPDFDDAVNYTSIPLLCDYLGRVDP